MYTTSSGLSPETAVVGPAGAGATNHGTDGLLRPETVESLFILHRVPPCPHLCRPGPNVSRSRIGAACRGAGAALRSLLPGDTRHSEHLGGHIVDHTQVTGDKEYREIGWKIFQAIERSAKITRPGVPHGGYAAVGDVRKAKPKKSDRVRQHSHTINGLGPAGGGECSLCGGRSGASDDSGALIA